MHVDEAQAELRPEVPAVREAHRPAADDQPLGALDEQNQILLHEPAGGVERVPRVGRVAPCSYFSAVEHERLTGPVVGDGAVGQGEPLRPPIREMMHQRAEDLGGLFLDALNERQDGAGMPGENRRAWPPRRARRPVRSGSNRRGRGPAGRAATGTPRPGRAGSRVRRATFLNRRGAERTARSRCCQRPIGAISSLCAQVPTHRGGGRPDVGRGRRGHAGPGRQRTDHERRPARRAGVAAADPEPADDRRRAAGAAARRADQRPAGRQRAGPVPVRSRDRRRRRRPLRRSSRPRTRCRTPAPTDRTPASASPARA